MTESPIKELKSIDLFVSHDCSEVLVSRQAMLHHPAGFSARIGPLIRFRHGEFFADVTGILSGFLEEEILWHDEKWPEVGVAEIDHKPRTAAMRKYLKKFKQLSVVTGGYNPTGISVIGYDPRDEIRFTFQADDPSAAVAAKFGEAFVECHWWERAQEAANRAELSQGPPPVT